MRNMNHVKLHLLLILLQIATFTTLAQTAAAPSASRTLVRTGHLLDVKTGNEPTGQTIIITGDRITAIVPTASTPKQTGRHRDRPHPDTPSCPASSTSTPISPWPPTSIPSTS